MSKLRELAKKTTEVMHPMCAGREKIDSEFLYGKKFTVTAAGVITTGKGEACVVLHFEEMPDVFRFGGKAETAMFTAILADDEARTEFEQNGLEIEYRKEKAVKSGNYYTAIEVV